MKNSKFLLFFIFIFLFSCEEEKQDNREKLYLGVILTLDDANGNLHKSGIEIALREINNAGGVLNDYKLEADVRSSQPIEYATREIQASATAQHLIDTYGDKLIGFVTGSSSCSFGVNKIAEKYNIPVISGCSSSNSNSGLSPYFRRTSPCDAFTVNILAEKAIKYGYKKIAIAIEKDDIFSENLALDFEREFKRVGGEVSTSVKFSRNDDSYNTKLIELYSQNPDAIYCSMLSIYVDFFNQLDNNLKFLKIENNSLKFIVGTKDANTLKQANYDWLLTENNDTIPSVFGTEPYPNRKSEAYKYFKEQLYSFNKQDVGDYVQCFYDIPYIYALAIERCGTKEIYPNNSNDFRKELNLQTIKVASPKGTIAEPQEGWNFLKEKAQNGDVNYEGASGDCNFDKDGNVKTRFDIYTINKNIDNQFIFKMIDNIKVE